MAADAKITEDEIQAYLDARLPLARHAAMEAHLAASPEAAARVAEDLATRQVLQALLQAPLPQADPSLHRRAEAFGEARRPSDVRRHLGMAAAMVLVFAGGWFTAQLSPSRQMTPDFVDDAMMSRKTSILRAGMKSQPEAIRFDRAEISAATKVVLPKLPTSWRMTDVQVYPSEDGPSVGMAFQSRELGPISLFAVRTRDSSQIEPTTIRREGGVVAYWRHGDMAYALMAPGGYERIARTARRLAAGTPDPNSRS